MPRRAVLSDEQRAALLALPDDETLLVQHWTLSRDDLAIIVRRRRPHNRLGFAIQLCALRYPGRFLRPGELIPDTPLAFVAEQLQVGPEVLADYATRGPTRYEQLDALRDAFGFMPLSRPLRTTLQEWLLPIALTTTSGARLARVMLDECRRRRIIVPGISSVERMVAQALLDAERHVAEHLTRGLDARQRRLLDALLLPHTGTNLSDLAWVRQSPGKPGRKTFAAIIERLTLLRAIGIDPDIAVGVHPERLRRLCQEGVRLTAQHVRTLQATRRRATLVATILETIVTLTDDAVLMFDRLLGQMFRREQNSADTTLKRNRRTINGKIRLLAQLGAALLAAKISGGDIGAAVEAAIGWNDLGREVDEARKLIRPDSVDPVAVAATNYPVLRQVGPSFIASFTFGAVPACHALARAVAIMRDLHFGHLRKLPAGTPVGFIRQAWRRAIGTGIPDRRIYELCVLVELRDRLRAGDMWVEGSRRYRAVEQQLIPAPVFANMRAAGPLPIPAPDTADIWLAERRARLARRLAEVERKAETDALEDVQLSLGRLRISPLKAITPEESDTALAPLYAHLPAIRITDLLAEVDRWTGFSQCFTHLQSGRAADEPRAILTAVLADATNLGHTRMAEACNLVTQRQLGWLASWHLREETYGRALARLVDAQHTAPLAALFGSGTSSSSDGQNFPLDRRAQATGAVNPHKGTEPAVSFYSHVSDRYAPFHSTVISASASEAAQVLDGLLHHGADLHIEEHHVDGGGVSDHVFALCHLLGFRFAPRIPNIAARRLHLFRGRYTERTQDGVLVRPAYELCALIQLRERLRAGDVWLTESRQYRAFDSYLLPEATFAAMRTRGLLPLAINGTAEAFLSQRRATLDTALMQVSDLARQGKLPQVRLDGSGLVISPLKAITPSVVEDLRRAAYNRLPRVKITDLLLEVDSWTGFTDCFTHRRSSRIADDKNALLTVILADGINLGLTRMADTCQGATLRQLAHLRPSCGKYAKQRLA
ncbi:Tn3 family transposase [Gluconobacter cerevisiae]|uniref:Tn3 family transposase n=14 Tax=Bacteria TaxID=2 RepID=A0ABR9YHH5_9PROT|nr:Tn3 family transposase [Gluconobacter cerevisiae]MBF0877972.1 Tn3 family transposase [Gluconobacter cerevisiae]